MRTPHTVTLYNVIEDEDGALQYTTTVLENVFLDVNQGLNNAVTGVQSTDAASLYIPFDVTAYDAKTGITQGYVKPNEYEGNGWTLAAGGANSALDCFFVRGIVVSEDGFSKIRENYEAYRVTSVSIRDFGSKRMQHWQVNGK